MDDRPAVVTALLGQTLGSKGAGFMVAEWEDHGESSAAWPIAPLHRHLEDDEAWYTLEGTLGFALDGAVSMAPAGTLVWVRPGTTHTYWNAGDGSCRYLLIAPPRVFTLIGQLHATGGDERLMRDAFADHAAELLDPNTPSDR